MESSEAFEFIKRHVFDECGFELTNFKKDKESEEYFACSFRVQDRFVQYRQGKITPTKIGQFVTIWKRNGPGNPIQPYDSADNVDLFVVTVRFKNNI